MLRTQRKRSRSSSCGMILIVIRTTTILLGLLLLASVRATGRSSGYDRSSCDKEFHHPDPKSCSSFLVLRLDCSSSKPRVTIQKRQCPLGLLFHKPSKTCEFPWNADCRLPLSVPPSTPTTRSLYSTIYNRNLIRPTPAVVTSESNSVGSESSTGTFVGTNTELSETTAELSETTTELSETIRPTELSGTTTELSETTTELSETTTELSETTAELSETTTELSETTIELSETTIELSETTTDFKTRQTTTDHGNQSGATVSHLFSVPDEVTVSREELTTANNDATSVASLATERKSEIITTDNFDLKTQPTSQATMHVSDSVATTVVTPDTSVADSTLGIGTEISSEHSVWPTTAQDETTYTIEQTRFNSEDNSLQSTATTPENTNRHTTMLKEIVRKPVTISTMLAESSTSAEFTSKERGTHFASQSMDMNVYSTAIPEYSQAEMTENVTRQTSVRSETVETSTASSLELTAESETTTGFDENLHSSATETAEVVTTKIMTEVNVTVDETDSFNEVTSSDEILTTKLTDDNSASLVTRLLQEVNGTQAMTTSEGTSTLQTGTEVAQSPVAGTTEIMSSRRPTAADVSNSETEAPLQMQTTV